MQKAGKERCPGEETCTTDRLRGVIARAPGRTLQNYCHDKPGGCPLFATKPQPVPLHLSAAIETAEEMRRDKELNLLPPLTEMPVRSYVCYRAADEAARRVQDEAIEEMNANNGNNNNGSNAQANLKGVTQGNTIVHTKGDADAFNW